MKCVGYNFGKWRTEFGDGYAPYYYIETEEGINIYNPQHVEISVEKDKLLPIIETVPEEAFILKSEEPKISERLFLEEMEPNRHEYKDRLILDTILMKFLSRKVSRLEDEIRYLKRHNNKKNRTIKRLTGQLSNVVVYLGEVCPASRAKVCGAECMDVMGKCQLLPLYRILGVNVERWDK